MVPSPEEDCQSYMLSKSVLLQPSSLYCVTRNQSRLRNTTNITEMGFKQTNFPRIQLWPLDHHSSKMLKIFQSCVKI